MKVRCVQCMLVPKCMFIVWCSGQVTMIIGLVTMVSVMYYLKYFVPVLYRMAPNYIPSRKRGNVM